MIVEIADSSLEYDRTPKASVYAQTGVQEYWVSDIQNDCVWGYSDIQDGAYQCSRQFQRGETVAPNLLPDCPIPINVLLP